MFLETYEFAEKLRKLGPAEDVNELVGSELKKIGIECFHFGATHLDIEYKPAEMIEVSNLPKAMLDHYNNNDLNQYCPFVQHVATSDKPLLWKDVYDRISAGRISGKMAETANMQAYEWGYSEGLTIPLKNFGKYISGIGVMNKSLLKPGEFYKSLKENERRIVELVETFNVYFDIRETAIGFYGITPKELDVLNWLADGNTIKMIAQKTKKSEHTVEKQLRSVRVRLRAETTYQAISKATMLGLIRH